MSATRLSMQFIVPGPEASESGSSADTVETIHVAKTLDDNAADHVNAHQAKAGSAHQLMDSLKAVAQAVQDALVRVPRPSSLVAQVSSSASHVGSSSNVPDEVAVFVGGMVCAAVFAAVIVSLRGMSVRARGDQESAQEVAADGAYNEEVSMISSVTEPKHSRTKAAEDAAAAASAAEQAPLGDAAVGAGHGSGDAAAGAAPPVDSMSSEATPSQRKPRTWTREEIISSMTKDNLEG